MTTFVSDVVDDDFVSFASSVPNSERIRLQVDMQVKF